MSASAFRAAVERGDADGAADLFAADAVFHSPIVHRPYEGREAVRVILRAVMQVFEDFRYTDELPGDGVHGLVFRARVGDRELEGIDLLRDGPAGPDNAGGPPSADGSDNAGGSDGSGGSGGFAELTVMVRPYSAATLLRERMAALLSA